MRTISKPDFIDKLSELDPREVVERNVGAALDALGWQDKAEYNGQEAITIGAKMAEQAYARLAASSDATERAEAEELGPLVESLKQDVLPHLRRDR